MGDPYPAISQRLAELKILDARERERERKNPKREQRRCVVFAVRVDPTLSDVFNDLVEHWGCTKREALEYLISTMPLDRPPNVQARSH